MIQRTRGFCPFDSETFHKKSELQICMLNLESFYITYLVKNVAQNSLKNAETPYKCRKHTSAESSNEEIKRSAIHLSKT